VKNCNQKELVSKFDLGGAGDLREKLGLRPNALKSLIKWLKKLTLSRVYFIIK